MMLKCHNVDKDVELNEKERTTAKGIRADEIWKRTLDNYKAQFGEEIARSHGNRDLKKRLVEQRQQSKEDFKKLLEKNEKLEDEVKKVKRNLPNTEEGFQDGNDALRKQVDIAEASRVATQTD